MSNKISPKLYEQIKSIYSQKNSLLRFRVLRLQRELREAKENLSTVAYASSATEQTLLMLKHEQCHAAAISTQEIIKQNQRMSTARARLIELTRFSNDIKQSIADLQEAIPLCTKMEAKNNIRCDYLNEQVSEPEESLN